MSLFFISCKKDAAQPLPAPTGLTISWITGVGSKIDWNSVNGAGSYYVYRSVYAYSGTFHRLIGVTGNSFTDTSSVPTTGDKKYYYRIAVVNNSGLETVSDSTLATPAH